MRYLAGGSVRCETAMNDLDQSERRSKENMILTSLASLDIVTPHETHCLRCYFGHVHVALMYAIASAALRETRSTSVPAVRPALAQ